MSDLQEQRLLIESTLGQLESEVASISKKDPISKTRLLKKLHLKIREVSSDIQTFSQDLLGSDPKTTKKYDEVFKLFTKRLKKLKDSYEDKKTSGTQLEQLFAGMSKPKVDLSEDTSTLTQDQIIQRGQQIQEEDLDILLQIDGNVERCNDQADEINIKLDEQIRKLDKINADAKDLESEINRAARYIRQFLRSIYTDKILMCLIFLIFCAIVTLLVLQIMGIGLTSKTQDVVA